MFLFQLLCLLLQRIEVIGVATSISDQQVCNLCAILHVPLFESSALQPEIHLPGEHMDTSACLLEVGFVGEEGIEDLALVPHVKSTSDQFLAARFVLNHLRHSLRRVTVHVERLPEDTESHLCEELSPDSVFFALL